MLIFRVIFVSKMPPSKLRQLQKSKCAKMTQKYLSNVQKQKQNESGGGSVGAGDTVTGEHDISSTLEAANKPNERPVDIRKESLHLERHVTDSSERILLLKEKRLCSMFESCLSKCCQGNTELWVKTEQCKVFCTLKCSEYNGIVYEDGPKEIKIEQNRKTTEVNLRFVYISMVNDVGNAGMSRTCTALGIRRMPPKTYQKYKNVICRRVASSVKEHQDSNIFSYYAKKLNIECDENGILNIDVSFDGTWMRRGHNSRIGCAFVIECYTGTAVDFLVLSTYCHACIVLAEKRKKNKITEEQYREKLRVHKEKKLCKKNFTGSSNAMDKEAAVILWNRSMTLKLRYTTMVSDGDSSAFKSITACNNNEGPYGKCSLL